MGVEVTVTPNFDRWVDGFAVLPRTMARVAPVTGMGEATKAFFAASQRYAHVDTYEMIDSGYWRCEPIIGTDEVECVIGYESDHALFEEARGGDHQLITRAWQATEALFVPAMGRAFLDVVESWDVGGTYTTETAVFGEARDFPIRPEVRRPVGQTEVA